MAWGIFWLFNIAWVYQAPNSLKDWDQLTGWDLKNRRYCEWLMGYSSCLVHI